MNRRAWRVIGWLAAVQCGIAAAPTAAQLPTRQEVTPPTPEPRRESTASVDSQNAVATSTCPFDASALRLTINRIELTRPDGSPLQPELAAALATLAPPAGEQALSVVCDLRDQANAALRRGGWIASVQIPAQEINDGVLRLQVISARVVEVRVRGEAGRFEPMLRQRIAQIQALDPLNEREAERLLLLAGDIPGLDVALALRPAGGQPGAVIGELTVSTRRFALFANAQNYNSRLLGRETGYVRGEIYGLTGLGDVTYLGGSATKDFREQVIVQGGHILTLTGAGTTLGVRGTYAWSRPDLGELDLRTTTLAAGFDIVHPLVRSVRSNARLRGGFDFIDQTTNLGGGDDAVTLTRDRLRVVFAGIDADYSALNRDGVQQFSLGGSVEVRKGLGLLNASERGFANGELTSRVEGDPQAWVVRGVVEGVANLGPVFSVQALGQVQWANNPLLNYDEFALGSLTVGRGYDPGANSGDRAVGGHVELRADLPLARAFGTQLYGFYDHLYLRNLDNTAIEGPRNFASVGGGVRFSLRNRLLLDVGYAKPLDKALLLDERKPPARLLVSLTFQFRDAAR